MSSDDGLKDFQKTPTVPTLTDIVQSYAVLEIANDVISLFDGGDSG
ncbi:MAG: hypothetical protein NTV34_05715 [Proteobacteria bacterium]|nr:hypothetical protein [Pseudomonadota bacterium]